MNNAKLMLEINHMTISFGGLKAADDISIQIHQGEFVGLIGPNGAGKTTFFNSITGNVTPTSGTIEFDGHSLVKKSPDKISHYGVSRTFQNIRIFPRMTVLDNVMIPMHSKPTYSMWTAMLGLPKVKAERARMEERAMKHLRDLDLDQYCDREAGTLAYDRFRKRRSGCRKAAEHFL